MARRYCGTIMASVEIDDVMSEISDRDVRAEFEERFGAGPGVVDFDLLAEVRAELAGGRPNSALALVESALNARRISDDAKRDAYDAAARVH